MADNEVTVEFLERMSNCDYLPDEADLLVHHFYSAVRNATRDEAAEYWKVPFWDEATNKTNPKYAAVELNRRRLRKHTAQIRSLALKHGLDPTPLLWFLRFIQGTDPLSDLDKRTVFDLVDKLAYALTEAEPNPERENAHSGSTTYSNYELRTEIGIGSRTLKKYADIAGVPTPGRGKRNHRYTPAQRKRILRAVIDGKPHKKLVEKCRQLLIENGK